MSGQTTAIPRPAGYALSESAFLVALALLLPLMVHLLPSWDDSPLGAKLLSIFYAPLLAAALGRTGLGLAAALCSPWLNLLLTGKPLPPVAAMLMVELVLFTTIARALIHYRGIRAWTGPASYLLLKPVTCLLLLLFPNWMPWATPLGAVTGAVLNAWPGIVVLTLIGWALRRYPPTPGLSA